MKQPRRHITMERKSHSKSFYLRIYPDSVLREVCEPVQGFDSWLHDVIKEMFLLMQANNGIGLAGPQVGIAQRLFIAQIHHQAICLINPTITSGGGYARITEGCLSLPNTLAHIQRNRHIDVQGYDFQGQRQTYQLQDLWARVIQHEIDHLNGILIIDHESNHYSTTNHCL